MIPGVQLIDSSKPGPILGITACTHGDEPAGLEALDYVQSLPLLRGKIYLVIVNLKGAKAYNNARSDEERRAARYIDINFNRLPENALEIESEAYELQRLKELMPIFKQFDLAIDIHSTTQECEPMIVRGVEFTPELVRGFPIQTMISRIDEVQIGLPGFAFHGGETPVPSFEIEVGSHESPAGASLAKLCCEQLLINLGMIAGESRDFPKLMDYEVCGSVVFPNQSYRLSKVFLPLEVIKKGQKLAEGNQGPIISPCNGCIIFAPKGLQPTKWDEEVLFITKPGRLISLE